MARATIHEVSQAELPAVTAFYETCGYSGKLNSKDTVFVAVQARSLVGAARLCSEHQQVVLRGVQVLPELQRRGIGLDLLEACMSRVDQAVCYCIPWAHLEPFYRSAGFELCISEDVPKFLSKRQAAYSEAGRDVVLMRRIPTDL